MSWQEASDRLRSEGGLYDISFFAASISHSVGLSREVFGRLSGGMLSKFAGEWAQATEVERKAYLLEIHEFSHHALMFSTPAGILLWRLNQVIARDISFLFSQAQQLGIVFPPNRPPSATLNDPVWQAEFQTRADVPAGARAYIPHVIRSLSDVIRIRSIFFDRDGAVTNSELTFDMLIELLKRTFIYLQERCEVRFVTKWTTQLPPDTKVFPEGKVFNVTDIAEAHAMAGELFVLRAFQDMEGFERRRQAAATGPFGAAFAVGASATAAVNTLGISPHQVQLAALVACASTLDVANEEVEELVLEAALPWWRFTSPDVLKAGLVVDALRNCRNMSAMPLINAGSRWLIFTDVDLQARLDGPQAYWERLTNVVTSLQSLSLDLQIRAIHQGLSLNARYLVSMLADSNAGIALGEFSRLSPEAWRSELLLAVLLIEYSDEFFFPGDDLDEVYGPDDPIRRLRLYPLLQRPGYQLLGHILNGATHRTLYAAYARRLIPRSEVLQPKFEKLVGAETARFMRDIVAALFERGFGIGVDLAHLNVLPDYIPADRYIG
jgi:hypothetical protein